MSRVLALTGSPEFERRLSTSLATGHELQVLAAVGTPAELLNRNNGGIIHVVVLGPDLTERQALDLAAGFDRLHPEIAVVLLAAPSTDLMLAALRCGIRDVLAPDTAGEPLRQALERAAATAGTPARTAAGAPEQRGTRGRVISVMSPKGGVGKTTVATNVAVGLAARAPRDVVIVDLDLQFGDVASGLGLEPNHTIADAVRSDVCDDAMVLKAYLSPHPSGLYAMCAPLLPADADLIKPAHVSALINQLSLEFAFVIVDTSPGLGEVLLSVLEQATDGVWVCGMDIPSIRGLNHGLDALRQLDLMPPANSIVLNFAAKTNGLSIKDVEATVGLPVDVVLPHSRTLPFSTNAGIPLLQGTKRDPVSKGLRKLLDKLTGNPAATKNTHRRAVIS